MKTPSVNFQQMLALAWSLALPLGWLLGWAVGAAIGYIFPELFSGVIPPVGRQIGASDSGWLGGIIGTIIGWGTATAITISALRSIIPALKSSQAMLIFLVWVLPLVVFFSIYYIFIQGV